LSVYIEPLNIDRFFPEKACILQNMHGQSFFKYWTTYFSGHELTMHYILIYYAFAFY